VLIVFGGIIRWLSELDWKYVLGGIQQLGDGCRFSGWGRAI
jgi:hypothetical protein